MDRFRGSNETFEYRVSGTFLVKSDVLRLKLRIVRLGTVSGDPWVLWGSFDAVGEAPGAALLTIPWFGHVIRVLKVLYSCTTETLVSVVVRELVLGLDCRLLSLAG